MVLITMRAFFLVEEDGFEPSKLEATDLQSAPFGHSGTPPDGAGERTRTPDLLITKLKRGILDDTKGYF